MTRALQERTLQEQTLRTGFTGYYGMRNFGDDLFGVLCTMAARRYWGADPVLVGPALTGMDAASTLPRRFPVALYGARGAAGKLSRLLSFMRGVRAADVMVMGGGSVITGRDSFRKPLMLSAQRRRGLQLAAVGVSIGPFADAASQEAVAAYARRFSYIAVRDRRSYELALQMGLADITCHGRDLAGLLPLLAADARPSTRSRHGTGNGIGGGPWRLGLAPCAYPARNDHPVPSREAWHHAVIEAIVQMAKTVPLHVDVFSLNGHPLHGDQALAENLQSRLRDRGIVATLQPYRGHDPLATVAAIGRCDAFISARLHGAIVAYMCDVRFAIVDYHPKCRDFADDVGLPAVLRITAGHCGIEALSAAVAALLNGTDTRPGVSPHLYARQAAKTFQYAPWSSSGAQHEE